MDCRDVSWWLMCLRAESVSLCEGLTDVEGCDISRGPESRSCSITYNTDSNNQINQLSAFPKPDVSYSSETLKDAQVNIMMIKASV